MWTTVLGAFDPLEKISVISKKYHLWLHVDAALWWWALLSSKHKKLLNWIEKSDSVSRSLHKMMNVPILAAIFLVNDKNILFDTFSEDADYLFQMDDKDVNPWNKSLQCWRRNDAFKVRAALKYLGEDWYEKRVNKQFENAVYATNIIKNDPELELILEPECINVCFQVKWKSTKKICDNLDKQWLIKVSYWNRRWQEFIRLMTVNADMEKEDIDNFFKLVKSVDI